MIIDLTTEEGADIAAGMRGPDFEAEGLKHVFTAYLRYLAGYDGGTIRRYSLSSWEVDRLRRNVSALDEKQIDIDHYMAHVGEAAIHLLPSEEVERFMTLVRIVRTNTLSLHNDTAVYDMAGGRLTDTVLDLS